MNPLGAVIRKFANADLSDAQREAKARARARLLERNRLALNALLDQCGIEADGAARATAVLAGLANVLELDAGYLRAEDRIGDVLRVPHAELSVSAQAALRKHQIGDPLEVGSYDFLAALDKIVSRREWRVVWASIQPQPRSDEDWLDAFGDLTVRGFVQLLAPRFEDRRI